MTIHHDKLAYGKLASNMEEMSEKQIEEMLNSLSEEQEESAENNSAAKNDNNNIKKL